MRRPDARSPRAEPAQDLGGSTDLAINHTPAAAASVRPLRFLLVGVAAIIVHWVVVAATVSTFGWELLRANLVAWLTSARCRRWRRASLSLPASEISWISCALERHLMSRMVTSICEIVDRSYLTDLFVRASCKAPAPSHAARVLRFQSRSGGLEQLPCSDHRGERCLKVSGPQVVQLAMRQHPNTGPARAHPGRSNRTAWRRSPRFIARSASLPVPVRVRARPLGPPDLTSRSTARHRGSPRRGSAQGHPDRTQPRWA